MRVQYFLAGSLSTMRVLQGLVSEQFDRQRAHLMGQPAAQYRVSGLLIQLVSTASHPHQSYLC